MVLARRSLCVSEEGGGESSDLLAVSLAGSDASRVELVIDLDKRLRSCRSVVTDPVVHPG
ncbi:hypothetical protein [Rathayibacter sp. VKM Ac-2801]|uniref:hypothetical protein n=1 Tax=Rathayibacter sp. VKM Ac-2801 TaxID=2609255 RepID=UPI00131F96AB|nr:hypothetical protein [Rathayibacter sp. VKM Ac-2801]QHC69377.1 hypothetical protein GSU45_02575 [Rathayibacter sp. VKM Ac-2801]